MVKNPLCLLKNNKKMKEIKLTKKIPTNKLVLNLLHLHFLWTLQASSAAEVHVHSPHQHLPHSPSPPETWRILFRSRACGLHHDIIEFYSLLLTLCLIQASTFSTFWRNSRKSLFASRAIPLEATAFLSSSQRSFRAAVLFFTSLDFGWKRETSSSPD